MTEMLILVDQDDNPTGTDEKVRCHQNEGMLHRAFTALLFDHTGRLLLTRRAASKMLWPNAWDGSVASHPRHGETYVTSAERRLPEELGVHCTLDYMFKFEYHVADQNRGSENEICGTLIGTVDPAQIKPDSEEISDTRFVTPSEIYTSNNESYCPWMLLALAILPRYDIPEKYHISEWVDAKAAAEFLRMVKAQIPDHRWRIVS